eukprot:13430891-Heterocapsa_arctica.AAC.1
MHHIGELVPSDVIPNVIPAGRKAIVDWDGELIYCEWVDEDNLNDWKKKKAPLDARIMKITTQGGKRSRVWADAVSDVNCQQFADWPLKGPRTANWCVDFLANQPGGAQ